MYASSSTTSSGRRSRRSRSASATSEPSGLLGEVRNSSFGRCAATAASMAARTSRAALSAWATRLHVYQADNGP